MVEEILAVTGSINSPIITRQRWALSDGDEALLSHLSDLQPAAQSNDFISGLFLIHRIRGVWEPFAIILIVQFPPKLLLLSKILLHWTSVYFLSNASQVLVLQFNKSSCTCQHVYFKIYCPMHCIVHSSLAWRAISETNLIKVFLWFSELWLDVANMYWCLWKGMI